jgi:hypothetical protein
MGYSLGISTSESQDSANNQSTVYVTGTLYTGGNSYSGYSTSYSVVIGGMTVASGGGPSALYNPNSWSFSGSYTFTHDANGERGAVGTAVYFSGSGGYSPGNLGTGGTTYGAINYDRKPAAPSTVTPVLNSDKSISVTSNAVSSPAGTATYYVAYSSNGGSTWSSDITIGGNARTYSFAPGSLTYGLTYKFRMKASNSDGTSAYTTTTTDTFLPAGGKRFDGSTWNATGTAKRFDGTSWITLATAKRFNGTSWVDLS